MMDLGFLGFMISLLEETSFPSSFHKCAKQVESRDEKQDTRERSPVRLRCINKISVTIKDQTGHRSLEALRKYKRTGSDQHMQVSMALLPSIAKKSDFAKVEIENIPQLCMEKEKNACCGSDDDDFVPMRKKKFDPEENIKAMFPKSTLTNCTFNINIGK